MPPSLPAPRTASFFSVSFCVMVQTLLNGIFLTVNPCFASPNALPLCTGHRPLSDSTGHRGFMSEWRPHGYDHAIRRYRNGEFSRGSRCRSVELLAWFGFLLPGGRNPTLGALYREAHSPCGRSVARRSSRGTRTHWDGHLRTDRAGTGTANPHAARRGVASRL